MSTCTEKARLAFEKQVQEREMTLMGEYINATTKVALKCAKGHPFAITPRSFKSGNGCAVCSGNCPIQGKIDFEKQLKERDMTLIGEYVSNRTKVALKCAKGHPFAITPRSFKSGNGCAACAGLCPIQSRIDFERKVQERGMILLSEYIDSRTKVALKCAKGHPFAITPSHFKKGQGCSVCSGHCPIQARLDFETQVEQRGMTLMGEYIDNRTKVALKCPTGHPFVITPKNFKKDMGVLYV